MGGRRSKLAKAVSAVVLAAIASLAAVELTGLAYVFVAERRFYYTSHAGDGEMVSPAPTPKS